MLVAMSELFGDCVQRRVVAGASRSEAERLCARSSWPVHKPPYPSEGAGRRAKAPAAQRGSEVGGRSHRPAEALVRPARWGGATLAPPVVPLGPDTRTEAYVWAREQLRSGHRPPLSKEDWAETARRRGMGPDQIEVGWRFIVDVLCQGVVQARDHVVASIARGLGEQMRQQLRGYSVVMPAASRVMDEPPVYPFQSQEAEKVYGAARDIAASDRSRSIDDVYARALKAAGVSQLSPADKAVMDLAISWELSGKDPPPEPPPVGTQRSSGGMKGTQSVAGRELPPRGAP